MIELIEWKMLQAADRKHGRESFAANCSYTDDISVVVGLEEHELECGRVPLWWSQV